MEIEIYEFSNSSSVPIKTYRALHRKNHISAISYRRNNVPEAVEALLTDFKHRYEDV